MKDTKISEIAGLGLPLVGVLALLALSTLMLTGQKADANPGIASKTGKACTACHTTPPKLNAAGQKYKQTGKT
jgi:cytochrome c551/c552